MGWNMEIVAVRTDKLHHAVPDVFIQTDTTMGFEDATSARRHPDLCAARLGEWVVVIDVSCRLSATADYLDEASASRELHLVRISDDAVALHWRDGEQVGEATPDEGADGESWAQRQLRERTGGVDLGETEPLGLWNGEFTLFSLN